MGALVPGSALVPLAASVTGFNSKEHDLNGDETLKTVGRGRFQERLDGVELKENTNLTTVEERLSKSHALVKKGTV